MSALGYRTDIWTATPVRDSGDADIDVGKQNDGNRNKVIDLIKGWFGGNNQRGFISLEHDIDSFTTGMRL